MSREQLLARFVEWSQSRPDVRGALLIGSQARADRPADEWSDTDLVLLVDDPGPYLADERWLDEIGRPLLTFLEATPVGQMLERRVLFAGGFDFDISVFPLAGMQQAVGDPGIASVLGRGYRVLVDKAGIADLVADAAGTPAPRPAAPDAGSLHELGTDFWYHALWAAKKLARGELLTATRAVDGYLLEQLIVLCGWHARAGDDGVDTWHETRFFERWAEPHVVALLRGAYARYDRDDAARALVATMDAFEQLERETASRLGIPEPPGRDEVRALVETVLS